MHLVTQSRLDQANHAVTCELDGHGFYDRHVQAVDTYLVLFGTAYGWQWYGSTGDINIPRVSLSRLSHLWKGGYTSLRDVSPLNTASIGLTASSIARLCS